MWERVAGACTIGRGVDGVETSSTTQQSSCSPLATLGTMRQSASGGSVTLGCGDSTLGWRVVCCAAGVARTLLRCAFAFATSLFAIAILVKRLLTFFNASVVSFPAGILPWSAVASCCAAATTWDSGETVGLVMYWCLKCTVSLILVALVFVTYTRKHRWCSIDVPRLKPASDLHRTKLWGSCVPTFFGVSPCTLFQWVLLRQSSRYPSRRIGHNWAYICPHMTTLLPA